MKIEEKVRELVACYFARNVEQTVAANPDLNKVIEKAAEKNIEKKLDEFVLKGKLDIKQAYNSLERLSSNLRDFDYVRAYLMDIKECWLKSKESYGEEYQAFLDDINTVGEIIGVNVTDSFISAKSNVLNYLQKKDNVIFYLVKKAKENGLETVNEEAIKTGIKKEYPTAKDYIQSFRNRITASIELVCVWSNLNAMAKETAEVYAYCVGDILVNTFLKKDVKIVYGE
jgi:hypothetical protein